MPITQTAAIMNVLQSQWRAPSASSSSSTSPRRRPTSPTRSSSGSTEGHITLADVSFRCLPDVPLIEDLDLNVQAGETVAIVGPTGAGRPRS